MLSKKAQKLQIMSVSRSKLNQNKIFLEANLFSEYDKLKKFLFNV